MIHNATANQVRTFASHAAATTFFSAELPNGLTLEALVGPNGATISWRRGADFAIHGRVPHTEESIYQNMVELLQPI